MALASNPMQERTEFTIQDQAKSPQVTEPQKEKVDIYGEMLKLEDLRKKGILTEEEFMDMKKRLLSDSQS